MYRSSGLEPLVAMHVRSVWYIVVIHWSLCSSTTNSLWYTLNNSVIDLGLCPWSINHWIVSCLHSNLISLPHRGIWANPFCHLDLEQTVELCTNYGGYKIKKRYVNAFFVQCLDNNIHTYNEDAFLSHPQAYSEPDQALFCVTYTSNFITIIISHFYVVIALTTVLYE